MPTDHQIIDIHTHVNYHGHTINDAVRNMDRHGIEKAWLLAWDAPADEYGAGDPRHLSPHQVGLPFSDIVDATQRYPDRFVAGWAIDPRRPSAIDRLRNAVETFRVRVYGELKLRLMYDDLDLIAMYRACGELGLPVLFHLEIELPNPGGASVGGGPRPYWYGGHFDVVERFLRQCPDTMFIGHAPGFWREISGDAERQEIYPRGPVLPGGRLTGLLDRFPNLHCDLSAESGFTALSRDPQNAHAFLTRYRDRVLFGRDYWDDRLRAFLLGLGLADDILAGIFSGNALRLVPDAAPAAGPPTGALPNLAVRAT